MSNAQAQLESVPLELHGHRKKLKFIVDCIEDYRGGKGRAAKNVRVLEIGCSNGRNIATPLARSGYDVTGIDIHAESIDYARRATPEARFLCQDLSTLPTSEQFDIILLSDVLEHVDDPRGMCRAAIRHLAGDGLILISIPNGYGPYELEQRVLKLTRLDKLLAGSRRILARLLRRPSAKGAKLGPAYNFDSGHVQFFHLRDFERLLDDVGLRVVKSANGALFGGALTSLLVGGAKPLVSASLRVADHLPRTWVTTWYFACRADGGGR